MKSILASILTAITVTVAASLISATVFGAEWKTQTKKIDAGEVFILPELGAVILGKGDVIVVDMAGPSDQRPKAYRTVDLKQGDNIIMLNGTRVSNIAELEEGYTVLAPDDLVKFGIKRDGKMMIVSFPKANPEDLPQRRMVIMSDDAGGDVSVHGDDAGQPVMMKMSDGAILTGAGLIIGQDDGKLIISNVLPFAEEIAGLKDVAEGDVVEKMNGTHFVKPQDLADFWKEIKVGDDVTFILSRDGKSLTVKFKKPEGEDSPMIIRSKPAND